MSGFMYSLIGLIPISSCQGATRNLLSVVKGWSDLSDRQSAAKHSLFALRSKYKVVSDTITELTQAAQEMEEKVTAKKVRWS